MQVAYGPPGHRGVTHLMAVGDDAPKPGPDLKTIAKWAGIAWLVMWAVSGISPGLPKLHTRARPREW